MHFLKSSVSLSDMEDYLFINVLNALKVSRLSLDKFITSYKLDYFIE